MPDAYETILVARGGGAVTVTLNRPEKKNAINGPMWDELHSVFDEIARNANDRVLVLRGAGGDFCSGADMSGGPGEPRHPLFTMDHIHDVALALHELAKPAIACVDGVAVGAGWNLALGCDVVLATPRSRFAQIFVKRGLSVDFGGSWILPRLIGLHRAKLLCLTGELISAADAASLGLVNEVLEPEQLEVRLEQLVEKLVAGPPIAMALTKRLLNEGTMSSMAEALDAESAAQSINMLSEDAKEARDAFLAKREPRFSGR